MPEAQERQCQSFAKFALVAVCLVSSSGCRRQPVVFPVPTGVSTAIGEGTMFLIRWNDGPAVMICSDIKGGTGSLGSKTSFPPSVSKEEAVQSTPDGRRFEWQMETTNGQNIKGRLDGNEYDLAKGSLFLVKTKGGKTEVEQLVRDLSAVQPNSENCKEYARNDAAVSKFLNPKAD